MKNIIFGFLALTLLSSEAFGEAPSEGDSVNTKVIYGRDDRMDVYQLSPEWRKLASATAALVRNSRIAQRPGNVWELKTGNFGRDYNLCPQEPFRDQDTVAFCSGFFIGNDLMVTAGHCVRNFMDCNETYFVFGFGIDQEGGQAPTKLLPSQVYKCFSIVKSTVSSSDGVDFAVIKLNRPVKGVEPLRLRQSTTLPKVGDELAVIGHPVGLPTKLAANAFVRSVNSGFLVASLDTYGGNSGSAVLNARTGEVEGVLVRGETDFSYENQCRVSKICAENGCRGEDVTHIDHVRGVLGRVRTDQ